MIHLYSLHIWLTLRNGCVAWELTEKTGETLIKLTVIFKKKKTSFFFPAAWLPDFALFAQFPKRKTPAYKVMLRCPKNEKSMEIRR